MEKKWKEEYYTPTIDEMYPGFEFEEWSEGFTYDVKLLGQNEDGSTNLRVIGEPKPSMAWVERVCWMGDYTDDLFTLTKEEWDARFRVRNLNLEDIENLGWKFRDTNGMRYWFDYQERVNNRQGGYKVYSSWMNYDPEQKVVHIYMVIEGEEESMFEGIVRNKSELRKVMQMLDMFRDDAKN